MIKSNTTWKRVPIKEIYRGFYDGPHATPTPTDQGPIFLSIKNITEDGHLDLSNVKHISEQEFPRWTKRVLPQPGDIVFTYEATLHRYAVIPSGFRGCLGRRVALIRPDTQKIDTKFLLYYFFGNEWYSLINEKTISGSTVDRIPLIDFPDFEISLPSLPIQKKIAAVLAAYDDLIENNDRRITLLEKMAEEIYREWFVRLRFPGHEQATFHKGIPEGWEVVTLGDLADITSSKRIYAEDYVQDGIPFYRSKEIIQKASNVEITEPLFISYEKFQGIKARYGVPQEGDILMTSVGTLGISYFVKENDCFYFKDGNLIWFKKNDNCTNKYLYSWMKSEQGRSSLMETSIGTSQAAFTIVNLKKISIIKPSKAILKNLVSFIDPIDSQKEKLSGSVQNLKQTRDRLLTRLISGKLSVEELDIQFPPSMITDP
jgi:type I restriction enzyme, S subunit